MQALEKTVLLSIAALLAACMTLYVSMLSRQAAMEAELCRLKEMVLQQEQEIISVRRQAEQDLYTAIYGFEQGSAD